MSIFIQHRNFAMHFILTFDYFRQGNFINNIMRLNRVKMDVNITVQL
jgi:hypothetical protein